MGIGSDWLTNLPEKPGTERDKYVLDGISSGIVHCDWLPITSSINGHDATFYVCDDALYVDLDDGSRFRPQCTAAMTQQAADILGASMITAKISDLAYQQADVVLEAQPLPAGPDMVTTTKSKQYNALVEKKRAGRTGLIRDCGKAWILHNAIVPVVIGARGAVNYGFYSKSAPYTNKMNQKLWQNCGFRHNLQHQDYSQTVILMSGECMVDGNEMKVLDVMLDKELSYLLNYEGVVKYTRQLGV